MQAERLYHYTLVCSYQSSTTEMSLPAPWLVTLRIYFVFCFITISADDATTPPLMLPVPTRLLKMRVPSVVPPEAALCTVAVAVVTELRLRLRTVCKVVPVLSEAS